MDFLKKIFDGEELLAFIIKRDYVPGASIEFLTPEKAVQQVGVMKCEAGYKVESHIHKPIERTIQGTSEAIFVRSGKVEVSLFGLSKNLIESVVIEGGDIIFLISGGHGFNFLEDSTLLEIKQGPYYNKFEDKEII